MAAPQTQPSTGRPARRVERAVVRAIAAAAICVGIILAILPYQRVLLGYLDSEPRRVESSCPAPVAGVFGHGDRLLASDGRWTGEPPCRRSSAGRLGAAALLVFGGAAGYVAADRSARRHRQP
jgi:hypothetical protein